MARGNLAKERLIDKIIKALPDNYLGVADKKYYFIEDDGGEQVQIALTMTCPKTPIAAFSKDAPKQETTKSEMIDFEEAEESSPELTPQERKNIELLMEKLGL